MTEEEEARETESSMLRPDLWVQLPVGGAAGGQQEDGAEGGDGEEQAGEAEPEGRSRHLPPLLDIREVEDTRRCAMGLTEHLVVAERHYKCATSDLQETYLTTCAEHHRQLCSGE